MIELRADADTSSIAAELRSTDARLGRLFAQYQLKVPERFGSGPSTAQALIDFGADVLEAARRDGAAPAIALLEAELASLDVTVEGEETKEIKSKASGDVNSGVKDGVERQPSNEKEGFGVSTAKKMIEVKAPTFVALF